MTRGMPMRTRLRSAWLRWKPLFRAWRAMRKKRLWMTLTSSTDEPAGGSFAAS